jgi:NodT family efflux transporter outer membrane factor (OMF) lipoprotein
MKCTLNHSSAVTVALLTCVTGCEVGPTYQAPKTHAPNGWQELRTGVPSTAPTTRPASQPSQALQRPIELADWWTTFHDPVLDRLIAEAVRSNLDLRQAQERVVQARFQRAGVQAGLFPEANFDGSYSHDRLSQNGLPFPSSGGSSSKNPVTGGGGPGGTPSAQVLRPGQVLHPGQVSSGAAASSGSAAGGIPPSLASLLSHHELDLYQVGFDASWEADVWGGVRRNVEASGADVAASVEDRRDTLVTLLSEVARNYIELRGFQREIAIARSNLSTQQTTLSLTQERRRVGIATDLDIARASSQVNSTAAEIPSLYRQARTSQHALAVLLGKEPESLPADLEASLAQEMPIPVPPPNVPVGLPSELLRRRPDIRRAERQLAAATARIGVATADLYPRFALDGGFNFQAIKPARLLDYDSRSFNIGPSVSWPILDFGRIRANIQATTSLQRQALSHYENTVLGAYRDVEDALIAYSTEQSRRDSLIAAVADNRKTVELSRQLYNQGTSDFLNVLDAERSLLASEDLLAQSDRTVATNLVALYKALGGGWEIEAKAGK